MKNIYTFIALLLLFNTSFAGQFEKDLDHFTSIEATGNLKIFLEKGDKDHVRVENNDAELEDDRIMFESKGSELKVSIKNDAFKKWDLKIYITYTKIANIDAKKGAWIEAETGLIGDEIELSCTTDGVIKAKLDCETVKVSIFTSGTIRLTGQTKIAEYKVSTGGFISGIAVNAEAVTSKVSTGGEISCYATKKMDLKVNTGGTIKYKYDGEESGFTEKVTIAGTIKKVEN